MVRRAGGSARTLPHFATTSRLLTHAARRRHSQPWFSTHLGGHDGSGACADTCARDGPRQRYRVAPQLRSIHSRARACRERRRRRLRLAVPAHTIATPQTKGIRCLIVERTTNSTIIITQTRAEDARACSHAPAPLLPAHRHLRCTSASKASMSNCSPPSPAVAGSATETSRLCAAKGVRAPGRVTAGAERPRSTGTRGYGAKQPTAGAPRSRTAAASIARRALCSRAPPPMARLMAHIKRRSRAGDVT